MQTEITDRIIAAHRQIHITCTDVTAAGDPPSFLVTGFESFPFPAGEFRKADELPRAI
jgi:hypothetical protein